MQVSVHSALIWSDGCPSIATRAWSCTKVIFLACEFSETRFGVLRYRTVNLTQISANQQESNRTRKESRSRDNKAAITLDLIGAYVLAAIITRSASAV